MQATRNVRRPITRAEAPAGLALVFFLPVLVFAVALVSLASQPWRGPAEQAAAYPARLVQHVPAPAHPASDVFGSYTQPADVVNLEDSFFVLDTGNDRILVQDGAGFVRHVIEGPADASFALQSPMAIATDGRHLYVANTQASQVLVLEPGGGLVKVLALDSGAAAAAAPRPVGIAVGPDGSLAVSDPDNNRILYYDGDGNLVRTVGAGARAGGSEGFSAPGGVTFDAEGNLYVADILNARAVKLAPDGTFLQQFGRPGDTAGTLSRPKDVAVDAAGNVYVSDGLLAAVQVFDRSGAYLGFIGRADPADARSGSLFTAPAGLSVAGDKLYVIDRFAGLFTFTLPR